MPRPALAGRGVGCRGEGDRCRRKQSVDGLLPALTANPTVATAIADAVAAAATAVERHDGKALAIAHGRLWATLMGGAYAQTLAATKAGDADSAAAWLLLRDFKPTTKFARPSANATLAMQQLRQGKITAAQAAEAVRADLLDTYQARLESSLNTIVDTASRQTLPDASGSGRSDRRLLGHPGPGARRAAGWHGAGRGRQDLHRHPDQRRSG